MRIFITAIAMAVALAAPALAADGGKVEVRTLVKSTASWEGTALPAYPDGKPEVTILRITIPAGVQLPMHQHPVINAGVMVRGRLTVVTEAQEVLNLNAGDALIEVVNKWHYGRNDGPDPAEIVVFYAGAEGMPLSIAK